MKGCVKIKIGWISSWYVKIEEKRAFTEDVEYFQEFYGGYDEIDWKIQGIFSKKNWCIVIFWKNPFVGNLITVFLLSGLLRHADNFDNFP